MFCAEDTPSQQAALKPKQQPATENDQNAAAIGATSQSPIGSANPQQSQNSLNNSQQHQMVSRLLNIDNAPNTKKNAIPNHISYVSSSFYE